MWVSDRGAVGSSAESDSFTVAACDDTLAPARAPSTRVRFPEVYTYFFCWFSHMAAQPQQPHADTDMTHAPRDPPTNLLEQACYHDDPEAMITWLSRQPQDSREYKHGVQEGTLFVLAARHGARKVVVHWLYRKKGFKIAPPTPKKMDEARAEAALRGKYDIARIIWDFQHSHAAMQAFMLAEYSKPPQPQPQPIKRSFFQHQYYDSNLLREIRQFL